MLCNVLKNARLGDTGDGGDGLISQTRQIQFSDDLFNGKSVLFQYGWQTYFQTA